MQTSPFLIPAVIFTVAGVSLALSPLTTSEPTAATAPAPLSPEAQSILQLLQDRKSTLKDFTAKVDYAVENKAGDLDGRLGTLNYLDDGTATKCIFDFTTDTFNGTPTHKHHTQVIADGKYFTLIDYQAKQFHRSPSAGPANSLNNPIPLPIGIKVEDVNTNFTVTVLPAGGGTKTDANLVTLRLIPRLKGRFDYTQLDLTVDKKLQIPVKVIVHSTAKGEITTVKILHPDINTGNAVVPTVPVPTGTDWTIDLGDKTPATAPAK